MKLEATKLSGSRHYAVRPEGAVGTCGWIDGRPWQVIYVRAATPQQAVYRAHKMHWWTRSGGSAPATPADSSAQGGEAL